MKHSILLLALVLVGAMMMSSSCNTPKETAAVDQTENTATDKAEEMKEKPQGEVAFITVKQGYRPDGSSAPYSIEKVEVVKDVLHLNVRYSGGCEEHEFALFSNKMYAKSMPPQLTLFLEHDAKGDKCREMVNKDLYFYLDNIRYPGSDKVVLRINDLKIEPVLYDYSE